MSLSSQESDRSFSFGVRSIIDSASFYGYDIGVVFCLFFILFVIFVN